MKANCHLIFDRNGVVGVRKGVPSLRNGQYVVKLRVEIPDEVFRPAIPVVDVVVPMRDILTPSVEVDPVVSPSEAQATPVAAAPSSTEPRDGR